MALKNVADDYEALREDLKHLRADVAALAETVVTTSRDRARAAKESAVDQARHRLEQISSQAHAARVRGMEVVDTVEREVAGHPFRSVAAVFGVGMVLGAILNWVFRHGREC